jgi:hypothetical protein
MRNRLAVALEWFWAYLTYRPSTRLITGDIQAAADSSTLTAPGPAGQVQVR